MSPPTVRLARALTRRAFHASASRRIVHEVKSAAEFEQTVARHPRVVVDCFAGWCGPCRAIAPVLARHSDEPAFRDGVRFVKVDVDAVPEVAARLGVRAMPSFFFFRDGSRVADLVGANPVALLESLKKLAA